MREIEYLAFKGEVSRFAGDVSKFMSETRAVDRRNFEAFLFARVVHETLKKLPLVGRWYERRFQVELDAFVEGMKAPGVVKPSHGDIVLGTVVKP